MGCQKIHNVLKSRVELAEEVAAIEEGQVEEEVVEVGQKLASKTDK